MSISFAKKNFLFYLVFLLAFLPVFSLAAEINFSEIMFDPDGPDTDREWVEIKNSANYGINLEKYKFCDSGSCHKLYESGSGFKIPAKSFGIITKKPEKFKEDYPNFSGFILRASFSLTNSKELLELKNENGSVISVVEYNAEVGGKDGDTFSLFNDTWKNGKATPNAENIFQEPKKDDEKSSGGGSSDSDDEVKIDRTYVEISDMIDGKKKLKAEIIDNIPTLIAGAENEFNGRAYGITGIEIKGAEYFWNFGDGEKEYGKDVKHTFAYPGEYVLTLIVKSASFTGNTRKVVKVIQPNIEIADVSVDKNWIKLKNNYGDILKLDNWFLFVDGDKFKIPKETYILGKKEIIFPNKITNLDVRENSNIFLLFPNGKKATKFVKKNQLKIESVKFDLSKKKEKSLGEKIKKFFSKSKKKVKRKTKEKKNKTIENRKEKKEISKIDKTLFKNKFQKIDELNLNKEKNFILDNLYFIIFIFFVGILLLVSWFLNSWKNKFEDEENEEKEFLDWEIEVE